MTSHPARDGRIYGVAAPGERIVYERGTTMCRCDDAAAGDDDVARPETDGTRMTMEDPTTRRFTQLRDRETGIVVPHARSIPALLLDPDEDCREALGMLISDVPGVGPVWTAAGLADALRIVRDERPAIIFLDCPRSPKTVEVVEALRAAAPDAAIVLLCIYPERMPAAVTTTVDRCVHKDVSYAELEALTLQLLAGNRAESDAA